jgi:cysteine desulfurase
VRVYLDNNATTPTDPRVSEAISPWLLEKFGNASSRDHMWGWDASQAVEDTRFLVSELVNAPAHEVIFLSGATEGLNTAVRGYLELESRAPKRVVTCATEHSAVLSSATFFCSKAGVSLEILPVDTSGRLDMDQLRSCLRRSPGALVAVMAANNEIGTIQPMGEIGEVAHEAGSLFLCDTTQAVGKLPLDLAAANVDFATVSAHKFHGPQGVGALLVRKRDEACRLEPLIVGGGQEGGMRGGTLNVPGIVGLGAACRIASQALAADATGIGELRDRLENGILREISGTWVNGDRANRLCNTSSIGFESIDARTLIRDVHEIALATRSACASGDRGPSHVLKAIGLSDTAAYATVRFSLGRFTTREEIDFTIERLCQSVGKLRRLKLPGI